MRAPTRRLAIPALGLLGVLGLLGCNGGKPDGEAAGAAAPRAQVPEKLARELRVVCWTSYITPAVAADFERELGVHLKIDIVNNNEEVFARLQKGEVWDVWTPSDYMVHMASEAGLLSPLDHSQLPNLANVGRRFQNAIYDRDFKYAVPYYWGSTGWAYDKASFPTPPATLKYLFDPQLRAPLHGKIGLLNDMREVIGLALIDLGIDPNSTDPEHLKRAKELLLSTLGDVSGFDSETYSDKVASGKVTLQQAWSGDTNQMVAKNPGKSFVNPREGYLLFVDNFAIPKASKNQHTSEVLINYLLRPEVAAKLSNENLTPNTNQAATPFLEPAVVALPGFSIPEGVPFFVLKDLGAEKTALLEAVWRDIKAGR